MNHQGAAAAKALTQTPLEPSGFYRWYVVAVLFLAYAFSAIDARILTLLVVPLKASMQLSDFQISLLQGFAFALLYSVAALPVGRMVDGSSKRPVLIVGGIVLWSIMTAGCGLAKNFFTLFLARVGVGVGEATLSPSAYSLISDYFPKDRRALAISFYAIGYPIGGGLALILGGILLNFYTTTDITGWGFLADFEPWQLVFISVGLPGILIAALVATIRDPGRRESGGLKDEGIIPVRQVLAYLKQRWQLYTILIGVTALSGLLSIGTSLWYPTFLMRTYGMSALDVGFYYGTLMLVCGTIGTLVGGWLSGVLQRRGTVDSNLRIMFVATIVKALPLVIGPLMPTPALALTLMAVGTLVGQASQGVILTAIQDVTPNRLRGQVTALTLLAVNLIGLGLGSSIVAAFTDFVFGDEQALRYSIALTGAIFLPIMAIMLANGMAMYRAEMASIEQANARGTSA